MGSLISNFISYGDEAQPTLDKTVVTNEHKEVLELHSTDEDELSRNYIVKKVEHDGVYKSFNFQKDILGNNIGITLRFLQSVDDPKKWKFINFTRHGTYDVLLVEDEENVDASLKAQHNANVIANNILEDLKKIFTPGQETITFI